MTIEEFKEKKQALEKEIAEKIDRFEEESGVKVTDIGFSKNERILTNSLFEASVCMRYLQVNIEVEL